MESVYFFCLAQSDLIKWQLLKFLKVLVLYRFGSKNNKKIVHDFIFINLKCLIRIIGKTQECVTS